MKQVRNQNQQECRTELVGTIRYYIGWRVFSPKIYGARCPEAMVVCPGQGAMNFENQIRLEFVTIEGHRETRMETLRYPQKYAGVMSDEKKGGQT